MDQQVIEPPVTRDLIRIDGLVKDYAGFRVEAPSLCIRDGDIIGLIGPNGAGKSTLMRCLLGITQYGHGSVQFEGRPIAKGSVELKQLTGYVPDAPVLYESMTLRSLLAFVSPLYSSWDPDLCASLLRRFDLAPEKKIRALSKGMRTKVLLVIALAHRPPFLLLDEPASGLDPGSRDEFWELVRNLMTQGDTKAAMISSHQLEDIELLCNRLVFIHNGRMVFDERKDTVLQSWKRIDYEAAAGPAAVPSSDLLAEVARGTQRTCYVRRWDMELEQIVRCAGGENFQVSKPSLKDIFLAVIRGGAK